jgi:hypothetical protein
LSRFAFAGPDDYAAPIRFDEREDAYGEPDLQFQNALKFEARYRPDGDDAWLQEIDQLDIEDLDRLDPSMLKEAERRALRIQIDRDLRGLAQNDLYMYISLRYGFGCPEPEKVVYPHQAVVINDLMNLETTVQRILTTDLTDEEFAQLEDDPLSYWLTAPRGFVKTSTVSEWLEWKIGRDVTIRAKLVAANEKGSIQQLAMMKKNVQLDPLFRAIFPHVQIDTKRTNNKTNLSLKVPPQMVDTRNATIEAWGIESSPERGRTNLLWFDDVCTFENSITKAKDRENIKMKLKASWFPLRTGPEMIRIWTCTPFSDEDASMMLFRKRGWRKRFIKVSHDFSELIDMAREDVTYPLPARRWDPVRNRFMPWWSERELRKLFKDDPEEFEIAYRLNTVDVKKQAARWENEWFIGNEETDRRGVIQYGFAPNHDLYRPSLTITGVDLASGESRKAKNTAVSTVGLMEDGTRVLLEASYAHGDDLGCVTETAIHCARWNPDLIVVEDNAAQKIVVALLKEMDIFDQRIESFTTDRFKNAKLKILANEIEDGKWIFPMEHAERHWPLTTCKCGTCYLIAEMLGYPEFNTSDCLMATMFAREGLKMLGLGARPEITEFSLGKVF